MRITRHIINTDNAGTFIPQIYAKYWKIVKANFLPETINLSGNTIPFYKSFYYPKESFYLTFNTDNFNFFVNKKFEVWIQHSNNVADFIDFQWLDYSNKFVAGSSFSLYFIDNEGINKTVNLNLKMSSDLITSIVILESLANVSGVNSQSFPTWNLVKPPYVANFTAPNYFNKISTMGISNKFYVAFTMSGTPSSDCDFFLRYG